MALLKSSVVLVVLATVVYAYPPQRGYGPAYQINPRDCEEVKRHDTPTGIYTIFPGTQDVGLRVRCDMDTDGGGWTVIQRRVSSSNFYHGWNTYEKGFGDLQDNFWLGNLWIAKITSQSVYQLRVEMIKSDGTAFALYDMFQVFDARSEYQLLVNGYSQSSTAGDSLLYHNGRKFTTHDKDNDDWPNNCASDFTGAWWYLSCHKSNLNGKYGITTFGQGINWESFSGYRQSLTGVEMKVRKFRLQ